MLDARPRTAFGAASVRRIEAGTARSAWTRCLVGVLGLFATVAALAGCVADVPSVDQDRSAARPLCAVVGEVERSLRAQGSSFAELVGRFPPDDGGLLLQIARQYASHHGQLERFEHVVANLAARAQAPTSDGPLIGAPSPALVREARALDRALAERPC